MPICAVCGRYEQQKLFSAAHIVPYEGYCKFLSRVLNANEQAELERAFRKVRDSDPQFENFLPSFFFIFRQKRLFKTFEFSSEWLNGLPNVLTTCMSCIQNFISPE